MARQPLVLLIPRDRLTGILTSNGLLGYGYDVLAAASVEDAFDLLSMNPRIGVLVINVEIENASEGFALAKFARRDDPKIKVVYTCAMGRHGFDPAERQDGRSPSWRAGERHLCRARQGAHALG